MVEILSPTDSIIVLSLNVNSPEIPTGPPTYPQMGRDRIYRVGYEKFAILDQ